jgi:hypothetical protein
MTLQNRVTPLGELIADPARGLVYGNRGCLHDDAGRIRRAYAGKRWIACRLQFRDWHRSPLMRPGGFTELFFLDEATALAAGHRPCALCRREDYVQLLETWRRGPANADAIDAQLHGERLDPATRKRRFHEMAFDDLPDGTFVILEDSPHVLVGGRPLRWTPSGYVDQKDRSRRGSGLVLTPPSLVDLLRIDRDPAVPFLHPSALVRGPTAR